MNVTPKRPVAGWAERRLSLEAHDPTPFEDEGNFWRAAAQTATIVMCVLMLGTLLYFARALLLPVLCALAVGLTLGPLIGAIVKRGVPAWLIAIAVVLLLIAIVNAAVVILAGPVTQLLGRAPEFGTAFAEKLHFFDRPLAALNELQTALGINASGKALDFNPMQIIEGMLTVITPAALQLVLSSVLFIGTLFFLIVGRARFRKNAVNWSASRITRLRTLKILNDIEDSLGGYLLVVTVINLALGVVTVVAAMLMGLPSPILWGVLAFILNYIPYVGPAIMDLLLFGIGLLTFPTLLGALLPPAVFIAITTIEGHFLTPAIVGQRVLNLHPLAIFLSIAFWAWMWGPIGAFLATPILIVARVALSHLYPRQKAELPG
ncbi:MAG: AI-2E family transporter [Rhizobiales bacterium]|nr:AI-2E family transporter [Hyphomicrobiales bacterium]